MQSLSSQLIVDDYRYRLSLIVSSNAHWAAHSDAHVVAVPGIPLQEKGWSRLVRWKSRSAPLTCQRMIAMCIGAIATQLILNCLAVSHLTGLSIETLDNATLLREVAALPATDAIGQRVPET